MGIVKSIKCVHIMGSFGSCLMVTNLLQHSACTFKIIFFDMRIKSGINIHQSLAKTVKIHLSKIDELYK